jgi:hypothetical protein
VPGAFATDQNAGTALVCRNGFWMILSDLLSPYVIAKSQIFSHGSIVSKPVCGQMGAAIGIAYPYLIPQIEGSPNGSFSRTATDNGGAWAINLLDSNGNPLASATAILLSMCFY